MKLVGGKNSREGNVYIRLPDGRYGPIESGITLTEGNVICKQVGFASAASVTRYSHYGQTGASTAGRFSCSGNEESLLACNYDTYGYDRSRNSASGVVCNEVEIDFYGGTIQVQEYKELDSKVKMQRRVYSRCKGFMTKKSQLKGFND